MAPSKRGTGPIKRHHAFHGVIMVFGWLLPPLAVLVRFGIGFDLFLNIILTICGYIPGHGHNFWIQNIRNNKNAKHSPRWAIKYGLVKDYRVKKTANGWSDRYGQGAADFQNQEVIIDPITGETRRDLDSSRNGNVRGGHLFPSPWADNIDDSPRAEREESYNENHLSPASGSRTSQRDPVTGAILDGNTTGDDGLYRMASRRSLGSRYAERYSLGVAENSSKDSISFTNDKGSKSSSFWGSKKSKKKDRFAREADAMRDTYRSQSYDSFNDGPEEPTRNVPGRQPSESEDAYARRMIKDPMQDRHDF